MSDSPQTHYLNADFDLSLRPRSVRLARPALARIVRELSVQALLGAPATDAASMRAEVPPEFLEYLASCGASIPRVLPHPRVDPHARLRPFGWNAEAIELNRLHLRPVEHPPLSTIRRVNSRSFGFELEADLAPEGPLGAVVRSRDELLAFLAGVPSASAWVVKAEHGNSALANRRLRRPGLSDADRRFVDAQFAEQDCLVIEPWLPRERDWSVVFDVPFDPATLRMHEAIGTRDGAFIGALFDPQGAVESPWSDLLAATAERIASRLVHEGYFGPVCVDAFEWRDGGVTRLRPLVDLNCRLSMSDSAHRLWRQLAPERAFYYRFFNRRRLTLPDTLPQALAALGERRYDRSRRHGVLLASPLTLGVAGADAAWRPAKLAVVFVAGDRREAFALEHEFLARFEA